jgi:hypothetical protein
MREFVKVLVNAQEAIATGIMIAGAAFVAYYIYAYWRMSREGYRLSPQKILLIISTAIGCIWAWGFLPPIQAFFVANFFHGFQYFAIVWWTERRTLTRTLRLPNVIWGKAAALVCFLLIITSVGIWYQVLGTDRAIAWAASIALVISLMHFWYDGFIWSVRKQQI